MTDPDSILHQAFAQHQAGALPAARDLYRQVLALRPADPDALHLLGVASAALGETAEGIALIQQAIAVKPLFPPAYFNLGGLLLGQGQADLALANLMACIAQAPSHAGALAQSGRALLALGRAEDAVGCFIRALQISSDPATWNDLGIALGRCERLDDALAAYAEAVRLHPDYADAQYNRGCLLLVRHEFDAAADAFAAALRTQPDHRSALLNLALTRSAQARPVDALAALDRLLALEPSHLVARARRAALLSATGRADEAVADFTAVLALHPDDADALAGRGGALWMLDRFDEAIGDLDRALAIDPDHLVALVNRGNVLQDQLRYEAALAAYEQASAARPDEAEALTNRGAALRALGRPGEAVEAFRQALALRPEHAETALNLGMCLLQAGAWQEGWPAFEARLRRPPWPDALATFSVPQWDGQVDIAGKRVLLVGEQGLGDTIQFSRFARLVAARGATVILGVEPPLRRLMTGMAGVAEVAVPNEPEPEYDLFCPLLSLPARLGLTLADADMAAPYLRADPASVAAWQARLASLRGLKVGLVWSGDPRPEDRMAQRLDRRRSIPLERLAPLLAVPGVTFVSLQKGLAAGQAAGHPIMDWTDELEDFADTAGLIAALDLVISVDTSVAHAAGALGRPVWVLNRFDRCWRWMTDRTDTPWYPTMRLFTQSEPGVWDDVVAEVASLLARSGTPR